MKNLPNEKDWMLTLKGASGQPPTEHLLKVEGSSLRMTDAFIRPTGFGRHPTILDSTDREDTCANVYISVNGDKEVRICRFESRTGEGAVEFVGKALDEAPTDTDSNNLSLRSLTLLNKTKECKTAVLYNMNDIEKLRKSLKKSSSGNEEKRVKITKNQSLMEEKVRNIIEQNYKLRSKLDAEKRKNKRLMQMKTEKATQMTQDTVDEDDIEIKFTASQITGSNILSQRDATIEEVTMGSNTTMPEEIKLNDSELLNLGEVSFDFLDCSVNSAEAFTSTFISTNKNKRNIRRATIFSLLEENSLCKKQLKIERRRSKRYTMDVSRLEHDMKNIAIGEENGDNTSAPSEESPVVEKDNTFSGSTHDEKTSHNNVSDEIGASPCTSVGLNPDHMEISESKLDDKNIVETIVQMVQLEFLELELIEQEQKDWVETFAKIHESKKQKLETLKNNTLKLNERVSMMKEYLGQLEDEKQKLFAMEAKKIQKNSNIPTRVVKTLLKLVWTLTKFGVMTFFVFLCIFLLIELECDDVQCEN
jgi:hypothetical protein